MIDYYLKFDDRDIMLKNFIDIGIVLIHGEQIHVINTSSQYVLYEVGELLNTGGWHVNLRVLDPTFDITPLEPYRVYPTQPQCMWA